MISFANMKVSLLNKLNKGKQPLWLGTVPTLRKNNILLLNLTLPNILCKSLTGKAKIMSITIVMGFRNLNDFYFDVFNPRF